MLDRLAPFGFVLLWSSSFIAARSAASPDSAFVRGGAHVRRASVLWRPWFPARPWRCCAGVLHCRCGVLMNAVLLCTAHVAMTRVPAAPIALIQTLNRC